MIDLSIVIVNFNTKDDAVNCLNSIFNSNQMDLNYEVIVVDNNSSDGSVDELKYRFADKITLLINPENKGYAAANNLGIKNAKGKVIMILNSDTLVKDNALHIMYKYICEHKNVAFVGPKLLYGDGETQLSVCPFPSVREILMRYIGLVKFFPRNPFFAPHRVFAINNKYNELSEVDWISGAVMMFRREILDKIGFMDENFFLYYEETDWCKRAQRHKMKVIYFPDAEIIHLTCKSTKKIKGLAFYHSRKSLLYFAHKHMSIMQYFVIRALLLGNNIFKTLTSTMKFILSAGKDNDIIYVLKLYPVILFGSHPK